MFGDEEELGSPVEDHSSMAAIMHQETVPLKLIVYLFGLEWTNFMAFLTAYFSKA